MNFIDKDGSTKVYIPVHPWLDMSSLDVTESKIGHPSGRVAFGRSLEDRNHNAT